MTLYVMDEWEHNGYDDSDWYAVVYDDETDKLSCQEVGTTRFANALPSNPPSIHKQINDEWVRIFLVKPTSEIIEKARACLVRDFLYDMVERAYKDKIFQLMPDTVVPGTKVLFQEEHKNQIKTFKTKPCEKCSGGFWINPRNPQDKRPCFTCKGEGVLKFDFEKVKDGDKLAWKKIPVGTAATVLSLKSYGQFYRNGYNQPDGHNTTARLRLDDGSEAFAPLKKLRLVEDMPTEEQIKKKAESYAKSGLAFYVPFRTAKIRL